MQFIKLIGISQQKKLLFFTFLKKQVFAVRKTSPVTFGTNFWITSVLAL